MSKPSNPQSLAIEVGKISRSDRWIVHRRLKELTIPCWCPDDGSLWVEIEHGIHAILLRSAVQQLVAPRHELIDWLERCWETKLSTPSKSN
ncbi:MAG: hypothetical protein F6K35_49150 [Okeania sp. SIO2H7]|nr:hypothetical protein [Okeania sp. SIO2H7]